MKLVYIVTGDTTEVSKLVDSVRQDNRFLSDVKNVSEYVWYPIDKDTQVVELAMEKEVDLKELELLTADLTSITIGRLFDGALYDVVSAGETEVVNDSPNAPR